MKYYPDHLFSVANKWIREGAQAFLRKCPLRKDIREQEYKDTVHAYPRM